MQNYTKLRKRDHFERNKKAECHIIVRGCLAKVDKQYEIPPNNQQVTASVVSLT